jgi:hypothetical protein
LGRPPSGLAATRLAGMLCPMEAVARSDVLAYLIPGEQLERLRAEAGFEGLLAVGRAVAAPVNFVGPLAYFAFGRRRG